MPVLRGASGLAEAHDVSAHPSASAVRARWARQRAINASAKLAVSRSRSGNWAIMLSRSKRRGERETGRSDQGRRRVRGAPGIGGSREHAAQASAVGDVASGGTCLRWSLGFGFLGALFGSIVGFGIGLALAVTRATEG